MRCRGQDAEAKFFVNPPFLTDCCDDSKTGIKIQKIGGLVSEGYAVSGDTGRCAEEYVASARNIEGCAAAHKKNVETIVRQAVVSAGLAGGFQIRIELVHGECCMNDKPINNGSTNLDGGFCLKTVGFNLVCSPLSWKKDRNMFFYI